MDSQLVAKKSIFVNVFLYDWNLLIRELSLSPTILIFNLDLAKRVGLEGVGDKEDVEDDW